MKRNHFQKDLISLITNIPQTWIELDKFLKSEVKEISDLHFPDNTQANNNLEDAIKLIFRLNNRLD